MSAKAYASTFSRGSLCLLFLFFSLFPNAFAHAAVPLVGGRDRSEQYRPQFFPFDGGESAEYQASWNGIPVATAEIRATPTMIDGKKFYQVNVQARTWRYLELIWKMRDSVESLFEAETLHPRRFVFHQRENWRQIDTAAHFEPESKKWAVHRVRGTKVRDYEFVSERTLDPISAAYLVRSLNFKIGDILSLEVFGGKSRYLVQLEVAGQERVAVKAGDFDAYRIIPRVTNLTRSGYAGRVRQATLWLSADDKRRPLKIVSQAFIGSVNIEMVEARS